MDQAVFPSLQQSTLRMSATNAIRDSIVSGVLRPGQQLVQAEIAAQMNVSRAPIREALRQLEEEGLVESIPYRGAFVSRVTRRDIIELYSLRGALESLAARLAIPRCSEEDIAGLEAIVARMSEAAEVADYLAISAADIEFHTHLCVLSGHQHLLRNWQTNCNLIRRILTFRNRLSTPHVVVAMHTPIVEAVRNRDVDAAQGAIEEHCINSGEALASIWPDDESDLNRGVAYIDAHLGNQSQQLR